jgi:predicted NAD/FAD-binding protein
MANGSVEDRTFGDYLTEKGFSQAFIEGYAIPVGASIWSCAPGHLLDSPAGFVLRFYHHHGMLSLDEGPMWQTLVGGSRTYVDAIRNTLGDAVVAGAANLKVRRETNGVVLEDAAGHAERFDRVVLATHADQALGLLMDPSPEEQSLLGAWRYQKSAALLHSDASVMPSDRGAWASWNYVQSTASDAAAGPMITYHLDRLQGQTGLSAPYFLSLNPDRPIDPSLVHAELTFEHPLYTLESVATQPQLASLNGTRHTYYCGNYMGYGFHEDAVRSGADVGAAMGCPL